MSLEGQSRVIALVDMDCFYVQVEERDDPTIRGVPAAVVQYKAWKGGGIIAVNYEARAKGVTRSMRGDDARKACPEIVLVKVPETNEKANLTKYRDAGKEVLDVICEFSPCVERASIDEAYIDLTLSVEEYLAQNCPSQSLGEENENLIKILNSLDASFLESSFPVGFNSSEEWIEALKGSEFINPGDVKLAIGAEIAGRMRRAVLEKTGFKCSAGIAHNKVLAKLGAGLNKPNKQTVIPHSAVPLLYEKTLVRKVRMLGGQFGEALTEIFGCEKMSELIQFDQKQFANAFGQERGQWLYNLARGLDDEAVVQRQLPKSIGCSKNFPGPDALNTKEKAQNWIRRLSEEVVERIERDYEMNNRRAKLLTLHVKFSGKKSFSRSCGKNVPYNPEKMAGGVWTIMEKLYQQFGVLPIVNLGLIASKLEEESRSAKISTFCTKTVPGSSSSSNIPLNNENDRASPELFEESPEEDQPQPQSPLPSPIKKPDRTNTEVSEVEGKTEQLQIDAEQKSVKPREGIEATVPKKLVEATNVHIVPANSAGSDEDEVDIEGFTPDSPQVRNPSPEIKTSLELEIEADLETDPETEIETEIQIQADPPKTDPEPTALGITDPSKVQESEKNPAEAPKRDPSPNKPIFVCTKSPTKTRKAVLSKDNPLSLMFPSLSKYVEKDPKPDIKKPAPPVPELNNVTVETIGTSADPEPDYIVAGIDTRTLSKEYLQTCDICKKAIPLWEFLNHKDYHVALELQKKYNGSGMEAAAPIPNSSSSAPAISGTKRTATSSSSRGKSSKRGRPSKSAPVASSSSASDNSTGNRMRTLHSYFLPKN